MKRYNSILTLSLCFCMFFYCCQKNPLKSEIQNFLGTQVKIKTDSMFYAKKFIDKESNYIQKYPNRLIVYIDSTLCTKCELKNLQYWLDFEQEMREDNIPSSVIIIIYPPNDMVATVNDYFINDTSMNSFVFIDTFGIFKKDNPYLPQNPMLKTFLLNSSGYVLITGNPRHNLKIKELMFNALKEENHL